MVRLLLTFITATLLFPSPLRAVTCEALTQALTQQWRERCAAGNYGGSALDANFCDNITDPNLNLNMCRRDDANQRCIAKDNPILTLCSRASRMTGGCTGPCPADVTIPEALPPPPEEPAPYVPLPRLQIPLFTLQPFTKPTITAEGSRQFLNIDFIGTYLAGLYRFLVGIVGVVAGLMIVWAGVKWLTAAGSPDKLGEARRKIADAAVGLILVLGSYVVLQIINPELVFFKPLRVDVVPQIELTLEEKEEEETTVGGRPVVEGTICNTLDSCRALCNTPLQTWPTSTTTTPEPSALATITATAGIDISACPDGCKATPAFVGAIQRAGERAQQASGGPYTIAITSAFRPLRKQIKLICDKIELVDKGEYDPNKLGRAVAWPGGSNHGKGIAADVALVRGSTLLTCSGCYDGQTNTRYAETAPILADIMFQAGFVRYCKEIWHFELPNNADCRSNQCRANTVSCP